MSFQRDIATYLELKKGPQKDNASAKLVSKETDVKSVRKDMLVIYLLTMSPLVIPVCLGITWMVRLASKADVIKLEPWKLMLKENVIVM